jgi:hypothetical protein
MTVGNAFSNQIQNRNFLSSVRFKFVLNRARKVSFFSNSANVPGLTLGVAEQPNYLRDIPIPGDKMEFDDFNLKFLVDENLENYMQIQNWMRGLGFPESLNEIHNLQKNPPIVNNKLTPEMNIYSDGTLIVYNSNQNYNFEVRFKSLFPYKLSSLQFDSTTPDNQYFSADVKDFPYFLR